MLITLVYLSLVSFGHRAARRPVAQPCWSRDVAAHTEHELGILRRVLIVGLDPLNSPLDGLGFWRRLGKSTELGQK